VLHTVNTAESDRWNASLIICSQSVAVSQRVEAEVRHEWKNAWLDGAGELRIFLIGFVVLHYREYHRATNATQKTSYFYLFKVLARLIRMRLAWGHTKLCATLILRPHKNVVCKYVKVLYVIWRILLALLFWNHVLQAAVAVCATCEPQFVLIYSWCAERSHQTRRVGKPDVSTFKPFTDFLKCLC
jgi:hypothetical protein